jgi:putative PEP-CTERM system TPR-repeat lipoprotein
VRSFHRPALGLALLSALALPGCSKSEADAIAVVQARIDKDGGASAEYELKNLVRRYPDGGQTRWLFGRHLLDKGDYAAALIELQRALDLDYRPDLVKPAIAQALLAQGKYGQLITEFATTTLVDAGATTALQTAVAEAHAAEGQLDLARQAVARALQASPDAEAGLLVKARIEALAGNLPAALQVLDSLLATQPDSHAGWALKGQVLAATDGGQEGAIAALRKSLDIRGNQPDTRSALIALHLQRGEFDAATQEVDLLRQHAPQQLNTLYYQAALATATGQHSQARALYQSILRVLPDNNAVLLGAAETQIRLNALGQGEALAAKALALNPGSKRARSLLAQAYLRQGQPPKAIAVLQPLVDSPQPGADTLALAAEASLMNGDGRAADALYARLARLKPADARLRTIVASAGLAKPGNEAAFADLQAIAHDDKGISADLAIVQGRLRAREFEPALKAVDALQRKQPDLPLADQLRAQVLAQKNDSAGARQALEHALAKDAGYAPAVLGLAALDQAQGQPDAARKRLEDLLRRQPGRADALLALAELSQASGQAAADTTAYLERAVKADPTDARAWIALIDQHQAAGALQPALAAAQNAVVAQPKNTALLVRLGQAQRQAGETDQALSTFGKVISLQPRLAAGYLGLAEVQLGTGNLGEAARSIDRALERQPQDLPAQDVALRIALQQQRFKPALEIARNVQATRKAEAIGHTMEGEVLLRQGQTDAAVLQLRQALTLANPGQAPTKLHRLLVQTGRPADADALAASWLAAHPDDIGFRLHLADAAQAQGQAVLAEQRYREVLARQPGQVVALNNLAMLLAQQHLPGAVALAEQALKTAPGQPALLDTLALALAADQQLAKAVEVQKNAVALAPGQLPLRLNLVRLQLQSGDKPGAKANLDRLVAADSRLSAADRDEAVRLLRQLRPH